MTGRTVSRTSVMVAVPVFPARSKAFTVTIFSPSTRERSARLQVLSWFTTAAKPFTVTEVTVSFTVPVIVTFGVFTNRPV